MWAHIVGVDNIKKKNIILIRMSNVYINVVVVFVSNERTSSSAIAVVDVDLKKNVTIIEIQNKVYEWCLPVM